MKPLLAYGYDVADDEYEIVFARSEAGARAIVARRMGLTFKEAVVNREPAFDRYAGSKRTGSGVTDAERFSAGWSVPCNDCEHLVNDSGCWKCEDEGLEAPGVVHGEMVYCSERCLEAYTARLDRIRVRKAEMVAELLARCPFAQPLFSWVGCPG